MQETQVQSLVWEDLLKKKMATHSSLLVWEIPWTEEPGGGGFSPRGPRRARHDLATEQQQPVPSTLFSLLHALPVSLGTKCHFHSQPSPTHHRGNKQRESFRPPSVRFSALLRLPPPAPPHPRALPSSPGEAQGLSFLLCLPWSFAMSLLPLLRMCQQLTVHALQKPVIPVERGN